VQQFFRRIRRVFEGDNQVVLSVTINVGLDVVRRSDGNLLNQPRCDLYDSRSLFI